MRQTCCLNSGDSAETSMFVITCHLSSSSSFGSAHPEIETHPFTPFVSSILALNMIWPIPFVKFGVCTNGSCFEYCATSGSSANSGSSSPVPATPEKFSEQLRPASSPAAASYIWSYSEPYSRAPVDIMFQPHQLRSSSCGSSMATSAVIATAP